MEEVYEPRYIGTLCGLRQVFIPHWALATGILQARILKWVAIFSSRGSSQPRDHIPVYHCATWEALREFNDITSIKSLPENT